MKIFEIAKVWALPAALIVVYILCRDISWGYDVESAWWTHFAYVTQHGNLYHLLTNCAVFALFTDRMIKGGFGVVQYLLIPYTIAVVSSWAIYDTLPTVGLSGLVYAQIGLFYTAALTEWRVKIGNKKAYTIEVISIIVGLSAMQFVTQINNRLHIFCALAGLSFVLIYRIVICLKRGQ